MAAHYASASDGASTTGRPISLNMVLASSIIFELIEVVLYYYLAASLTFPVSKAN